ncbi:MULTISPECIES: protein kinase domain-containing protein [Marinomonas]|uniref:Protein kinase n=1 Tax=Marinomonas arctica TaxID=383750 RepID=A0A7H1J5D9_9GAMM|nr:MULTISPECIES: protein kinase [Marinomonas]MCS7486405.1 hypothetical protein [Marinomonas sp. BSi20414]QNT05705.1 protein kinase [Marinomonas arctica]GGN29286.1 hypothetical protein GCM10011350_21470 [Marinomonas arctica]
MKEDCLEILKKLEIDTINDFSFKKELGGGSSFTALYENKNNDKVVFKFLIFPRNKIEIERFKFEYQSLLKNISNTDRYGEDDRFFLFRGPKTSYPVPTITHNIKNISNKIFYFSYKYEEGELLSSIDSSKLNLNEKYEFLYRLSSAMNYFSRLGYEHRDLHPENILIKKGYTMYPFDSVGHLHNKNLLDNDPRIVFLDMGMCKLQKGLGDLNRYDFSENYDENLIEDDNSKRIMASFTSMPPDFLLHGTDTVNYDSWSFGVYAYNLIFDELPFKVDSISDAYKLLMRREDLDISFTRNIGKLSTISKFTFKHLLSTKGENRPSIDSIVRLFGWINSKDTRLEDDFFVKKVIHNQGFDPEHDPLDDIY